MDKYSIKLTMQILVVMLMCSAPLFVLAYMHDQRAVEKAHYAAMYRSALGMGN